MKKIAVYNPSDVDISPYPIEEAVLDSEGNTVFDNETQRYRTTGQTLCWEIKKGETKVFPSYVADYLCSVYGFLKKKKVFEKVLDTEGKVPEENPDEHTTVGY